MKMMNPPNDKDAAAHPRTSSFTRNSRSLPSLMAAAPTSRRRSSHTSPPHQHLGSVYEQPAALSSSVSYSSFHQQKRSRDAGFESQSSQRNQTWSMPSAPPPPAAGQSPTRPQQFPAPQQPPVVDYQDSGGKRSRPNTYRAPREVKASVTSVMGSLAGGSTTQSNTSVRIRRNLSGSRLDQFLSGGSSTLSTSQTAPSSGADQSMQMDTDDSNSKIIPMAQQRERAMSF